MTFIGINRSESFLTVFLCLVVFCLLCECTVYHTGYDVVCLFISVSCCQQTPVSRHSLHFEMDAGAAARRHLVVESGTVVYCGGNLLQDTFWSCSSKCGNALGMSFSKEMSLIQTLPNWGVWGISVGSSAKLKHIFILKWYLPWAYCVLMSICHE